MKNHEPILDCQPFHYELSGLANNYVLLLKNVLRLFEKNQAYAAWRLLDRAERINPELPIELTLLRAKALEHCSYFSEALEVLEKAYQLQPTHPETILSLLHSHAKLLPQHAENAFKIATVALQQKKDWHSIIAALQVFKQLQINPVGLCHYDGATITGWLLDSPTLPALTVAIDGKDFSLRPYMATDFLHQQGFGSGIDGFSLSVPAGQFKSIRIHLNGQDLIGSPIHLKDSTLYQPQQNDAIVQCLNVAATVNQHPVIDIIIPVYKGIQETKACFNALLNAHNKLAYRLIVIEDACPEPQLVEFLLGLQADNLIELIRLPINRGFVAAVNCGLQASNPCHDVILLNADTCVYGDWLDRLHAVAYQSDTIGSVTPLSNNAELLSFPTPMRAAAMPEPEILAKLNDALAQCNDSTWVEIPSGVGFCLYIKRCCLNVVGFLDDVLIERGYGEDTDFCLRIEESGWKNVCAPNVFVAHAGNVSFGTDKTVLVAKNLPRLHERYPKHEEQYNAFLSTAPLASIYGYLQRAILPIYAEKATALVLLPATPTDTVIYQNIQNFYRNIQKAVYYLTIEQVTHGEYRISLTSSNIHERINLNYVWPNEDNVLQQDLHAAGFKHIKIHAPSAWPLPIIQGLLALNVPYQIVLHDYSAFCLQNKLLQSKLPCRSTESDDAACLACISNYGCKNTMHSHPKILRDFSSQLFKGAENISLSSTEAAQQHKAYFPDISFRIDRSIMDYTLGLNTKQTPRLVNSDTLYIAVFFAATPEQGFFKLLELSRLLASKRMNVELVVFGETWDNQALLASSKVWLAGPVEKEELADLVRLHSCTLSLHLALWPEVDGLAWQLARLCGLPLIAPAIGVYKELLDESLGDICLSPDKTVNEWLQLIAPTHHVGAAA